jgi:tRNA threonylcarbamoyl adenosine modification protein (Sua5/YciO/YrdC/YwlC family)
LITSSNDTVAVRIPDNDIALKLLSDFGPLTVTSANIHGKKTLGIINDIKMQFNQQTVPIYLDYGLLQGRPSTIVDLTSEDLKIIREGIITRDEILEVI